MMLTISEQTKTTSTAASNSFLQKKNLNNGPFFQPKLTINQRGDKYEQEADSMADKVMRMPSNKNGNAFFRPTNITSLQRKCANCEDEEKLYRKENTAAEVNTSASVDKYIGRLNGSGNPLPESSRNFFGSRFGYDFSNVKIHNGSSAIKSAQSINALAYTTGNNIVFNQNQFSPGTDSGKKLLAHELTHVVQQKSDEIGYVQRMAACPVHLNDGAPTPPGWKNYFGSSSVFHCGFRTILEDRAPTPDDPMNECVYDHSGTLVDENHPYAGCRGTPDQYDSRTDPIKHSTIDSGGIVRAGAPALATSAWHAIVSPFKDVYNWMDRGIRNLYGVP